MTQLRVRPRFQQHLDAAPEEVIEAFRHALSQDDATCKGSILEHRVHLRIPHAQQHYWSPQLHLELEATEHGSLVRGLYGPRPGVWTMFIFLYTGVGFLCLMGTLYGLSQWTLDLPATGFWSFPAGLLLLAGIWLAAQVGQRKGREQTLQLHAFYTQAVYSLKV